MAGTNIISLFFTRRFLPYIICQVCTVFYDNVFRIALLMKIVYDDISLPFSHGMVSTVLMTMFTLPFCLISAHAGIYGDSYNKCRVIQISKAIMFITAISLVPAFSSNNLIVLLLCFFLNACGSTIFSSVKYSILPDHLENKELMAGNALVESTSLLFILIGSIVGTILSTLDLSGSYSAFILLITAIIGMVASLFIPKTKVADNIKIIKRDFLYSTITWVRKSLENKTIRLCTMGIAWYWMIGSVLIAQTASITKEIFGGDQTVVMLLYIMVGVGIVSGTLFCNYISRGIAELSYVPAGLFLMAIGICDLWYTSTTFSHRELLNGAYSFLSSFKGLRVALDLFIMSFAGSFYLLPLYTLIQINAPTQYRSRTIAGSNIVVSLSMFVGSIVVMILLYFLSIQNVILFFAILNCIATLYICSNMPYLFVKGVLQVLFRLIFRVQVNGIKHCHDAIKEGKKIVIISNHISFMDGVLIGAFLPFRTVSVVDAGMARNPLLRFFFGILDIHPVDHNNSAYLKNMINGINEGKAGLIFPEGRIANTRSIMRVYPGTSMILDKTDAEVLPVYIDGMQHHRLFSKMQDELPMLFFPKVSITVYPSQKITPPSDMPLPKQRDFVTRRIYDIMCESYVKCNSSYGTMFELLLQAKARWGSAHEIVENELYQRINYRTLVTSSFALGKKVEEIASYIQHDDDNKLGIMMPTCVPNAVLYFAMQAYGFVPTMINFTSGLTIILKCCEIANIKIIFTSKAFIEKMKFEPLIKGLEDAGKEIIYLEDLKKSITVSDKLTAMYKTHLGLWHYQSNNKKRDINSIATILFTSGSMGTPKAVALSHKNLFTSIKQFTSCVNVSRKDAVFNVLPMFHVFGLNVCTLMPILHGSRVVLYPSALSYNAIPNAVYGSDATIICGTDTFLSMYINAAHQNDFAGLKYVISGAEKLRSSTRNAWFDKAGQRILEGYGATETSPVISVNTHLFYKKGSVGRIVAGMEHKLTPVDGIEEGGNLIVKGDNVMLGYIQAGGEILQPSVEIDGKDEAGWYDTGDIVTADEEGFITIVGRVKRFAKRGGEMISMTAIEEQLFAWFPEDRHAVASKVTNSGEVLILFTTCEDMTKVAVNKLLKENNLPELWAPSKVVIK